MILLNIWSLIRKQSPQIPLIKYITQIKNLTKPIWLLSRNIRHTVHENNQYIVLFPSSQHF